jgi:hypothetical protein
MAFTGSEEVAAKVAAAELEAAVAAHDTHTEL